MPASMRIVATAALAVLAVACSDLVAPLDEITSETNRFQLQAMDVVAATCTTSYDWTNTGHRAIVSHLTTTKTGNAAVVVRDAAGAVVYMTSLLPILDAPTTEGVPGVWKIELILTNYSGRLNFGLEKR